MTTQTSEAKAFAEPDCKLWVDLQSPVVTADGLLLLAQAGEAIAFVVPGVCLLWVDLQGSVVTPDSLLMSAQTVEAKAFRTPG